MGQMDQGKNIDLPKLLPPGMTKEELRQVYVEYQKMRADGVRGADPEMAKATTILTGVSYRQDLVEQHRKRAAKLEQTNVVKP